MKRLVALLLLVALLVPLMAAPMPTSVAAQDTGQHRMNGPLSLDPAQGAPFDLLDAARRAPVQNQVRIEQRVVVRISPAPPRARTEMLAELPRRPLPSTFAEVEHADCVPVNDIVGVQPTGDNRLLFFTRQRQILAATLEPSCVASSFYSGFYVERNADGRLCVSRDQLQSRAGAACQVAGFTRLVAVGQ
ncbi:MAG: hypothetical protein KDE15_13170 [Erythrobacter sp.]|nr:hypothetical protein [Erythrobacter sp.]